MSLTFDKLNFITDRPLIEEILACFCGYRGVSTNKHILNNLAGSIIRGELIALMGPSGAGKSTFLNCITQGRKYKGFEGQITISDLDEQVRASFINQDEMEHLFLTFTVKQSLRYASELKNPSNTTNESHDYIVNTLIRELELDGTENTSVERCSGGQRKRLAIAMELTAIQKPHFLFLDEPTSGLDSFVGLKVVELLSRLSKIHNIAIVASIHQPSFKLFSLFSRAYVISGAGDFIYNGAPSDLCNHFINSGYPWSSQSNYVNPADIIIELASAMTRNNVNANMPNGDNIYSVQEKFGSQVTYTDFNGVQRSTSTEKEPNAEICYAMVQNLRQAQLNNVHLQGTLRPYLEIEEHGLCKNGASFSFHNLWILFLRSAHISIWKEKRFILIRLAINAVVAVVLVALYNRDIGMEPGCDIIPSNITSNVLQMFTSYVSDTNSLKMDLIQLASGKTAKQLEQQNTTMMNVKFQFFSLLFQMFAALMPTVLTFPADIKLFLNEFRNGWYSSSSYYFSKTITEIPLQLLFSFLYTYFLYWFTQQPDMDEWYGGLMGCMSWRYRSFLLVTTLCGFIAQGLGFLIGILCVRSFNSSIIVSSSVLLFLFLFSGFFVKRVQMGAYVAWITFLSFISFGFESLLIIIYGHDRCTEPEQSTVLYAFGLKTEDLTMNIWFLVVHLFAIRFMAFLLLKYLANPNFMFFLNDNKPLNSCVNSALSYFAKSRPVSKNLGSIIFKIVHFCLAVLLLQIVVAAVYTTVHFLQNN